MAEGKIDDETTRDHSAKGHTASYCIAVAAYYRLRFRGQATRTSINVAVLVPVRPLGPMTLLLLPKLTGVGTVRRIS